MASGSGERSAFSRLRRTPRSRRWENSYRSLSVGFSPQLALASTGFGVSPGERKRGRVQGPVNSGCGEILMSHSSPSPTIVPLSLPVILISTWCALIAFRGSTNRLLALSTNSTDCPDHNRSRCPRSRAENSPPPSILQASRIRQWQVA